MVLNIKKNRFSSRLDDQLTDNPVKDLAIAFTVEKSRKVNDYSSVPLNPAQLKKLKIAAKAAARRAYAPYSGFKVGAAVLTASGRIYSGSNVENASYGLSNCAERTAIFSAVAAGERKLKCVVVYTPTQVATAPCGACRQVIHEFGSETRVISFCTGRDEIDVSMDALLPGAFGPSNLA